MRDSGVSQERAEFFIAQYMKTFAKLKEFIEETKKRVRKDGFVETEFGRRRYLPNIKASNYLVRSGAERAAVNFPVQGLAADIMKLAMLRIHKLIESQKPKSKDQVFNMPKLELQIHDELIVEIDKNRAEEFSKQMKEVMEGVYKLKVPLVVDVSIGKNWGEL
jgi:DNA polymerase-1